MRFICQDICRAMQFSKSDDIRCEAYVAHDIQYNQESVLIHDIIYSYNWTQNKETLIHRNSIKSPLPVCRTSEWRFSCPLSHWLYVRHVVGRWATQGQ